jgi:tetratricopeptide (TPR) repeat protein
MRSLVPRILSIGMLCALALSGPRTFAQSGGSSVSVKPAAENLFEEGRALMQQQRYAEACTKFEASQGMDAGIGTLLHLADCYEKLGRTASAWATFKEAASMSRLRAQEEREHIALTRAAALEQRLSRLTIRVPEANRVEGLEIRIEGNQIPRASWDSPIPVDPGSLAVQASAPKRVTFTTRIEVAAAVQDNALEIPLLEVAPNAAEASSSAAGADGMGTGDADARGTGSTQRTAAWIFGGAGVVGIGVGAVLGIQANRKKQDSLDYCPRDPNLCTSQGVDLRDQAKKDALGSTIAFAAGGGLLATGLILLLTLPSHPKRVALSRVNVSLDLSPRSNTLHVGSAF